MNEEEKKEIFYDLMNTYFMQCDRFFIMKWSGESCSLEKEITQEQRKEAYLHFYKRIGKFKVASRPTVQKWFGIRGHAFPKREQILHLALELGWTPDETREYLQYGISEPDFQVNDYHEMIALYCLENRLSYGEYQNMTEYFETYSDWDVSIRQTAHTDEIMRQYEDVRQYQPVEFLVWMRRNEELFKGYSMTTYQNFMSLVEEALHFFREEIRDLLFRTLEDTGFFQYARKKQIPEEEYGRSIRQFIKNQQRNKEGALSQDVVKEIQMLTMMAYSPLRRVCDLLTELYGGIQLGHVNLRDDVKSRIKKEIGPVDAKYLSELIAMASHKKRQMRLLQAYTKCKDLEDEDPCPKEVWKLLMEGQKKMKKDAPPVGKVKEEIGVQLKRQRQRVHDIRRSDLLLLIQYISNKKYVRYLIQEDKEYDEKEARDAFVAAADMILNLCGMRPIDSSYCFDFLMLRCFSSEELYLLSDILEQ